MSRSLLADRLGDRAGAGSHAQRAAELAERSDAAATGALAHAELSWLARERGDMAGAHRHITLALPLATRAAQQMKWPNDDIYVVLLRLVAGQLYQAELDFDRYLQLVEEARVLAERLRHRRLLCSCHEALALWALDVLDTEGAVRHIDDLESLAEDIGQALLLAEVPFLRAQLAVIFGDDARAMALTREAETRKRRISARFGLGKCLILRAGVLMRAGEPAAAAETLREAAEIEASLGFDGAVRGCRLRLANAWRCTGRLDEAKSLVEAELPFLDEVGALDTAWMPLAARMAAWRVLVAAGDERAPRQLELAMAELQRRVAKVADPEVRRRMLEHDSLHREITAEWQAHLGLAPIADRP